MFELRESDVVWLNEQTIPISFHFEEKRIRQTLAVVSSTLDVETVRLLAQDLVNDHFSIQTLFDKLDRFIIQVSLAIRKDYVPEKWGPANTKTHVFGMNL